MRKMSVVAKRILLLLLCGALCLGLFACSEAETIHAKSGENEGFPLWLKVTIGLGILCGCVFVGALVWYKRNQ